MKWNTKRLNQPFTWYSADVIEKIKKIASPHCTECKKILEIIEKEDKESCKQ